MGAGVAASVVASFWISSIFAENARFCSGDRPPTFMSPTSLAAFMVTGLAPATATATSASVNVVDWSTRPAVAALTTPWSSPLPLSMVRSTVSGVLPGWVIEPVTWACMVPSVASTLLGVTLAASMVAL